MDKENNKLLIKSQYFNAPPLRLDLIKIPTVNIKQNRVSYIIPNRILLPLDHPYHSQR